eukprot:m.23724 g.23724  ORF g.23724 m.23724 type:complete len:539 (+) comp5990_c0_seq2:83-1699(+)
MRWSSTSFSRQSVLLAAATVTTGAIYTSTVLGEAEVLGGPTGGNFDSPFHVLTARRPDGSSRLIGFNNNGDSYRVLDGTSLSDLVIGPASIGGLGVPIGLNRSSDPAAMDHCGCWLQAAASLTSDPPGLVRGFYHEEFHCDYAHNSFTNKSIAYAVSEDGGLTFTKVGWPHNQIILPPEGNTTATSARGQQVGEGDHAVVVPPDSPWIYLFFREWDVNAGEPIRTGLARSSVADGGVPGTWRKYFCQDGSCGFTENGLMGKSSALANITGSTVAWRNTSDGGEYVCIGSLQWQDPLLAGFGPRLSFSRPDSPGDAPVSWQPANEPLIFADSGSWDRTNTSHELIAYASVVVDPTESNQLWFYYTYLEPGAGFTQRYFVRRRVDTVTISQPFLAGAVVLTMLKGPVRAGRAGDWWATTAVNVPNSNYTRVGAVGGAVFVSGGPNRTRLVDCYISGWDDHMVGYETECTVGSLGPTVGIRTLGFVLTEAGAAEAQRAGVTTTQIFRCFDNATKNHAISSDPHCQGYGGPEFPLGYVLSLE